MKKIGYILIILISTSCNKVENTPTVNYSVIFGNSMMLDDVTKISQNFNTVKFKVSTIYLSENYVFSDYPQGLSYFDTLELHSVNSSSYFLDSTNVSYNNSDINYSAAIIIDKNIKSGWGDQGYSDGFSYFVENAIKNGNECLLVGAARENNTKPCEFYTPNFITQMNSETKNAIYEFCSTTLEGTPSIYDAIDITMDEMINKAQHTNRHIVVFWDKEDDENGVDANHLISKATANNINISFFNWDHSHSYAFETVEISAQTGGFNSLHYSTSRIQTTIFSLHKLLSRNYTNIDFYLKLNSGLLWNSTSWRGTFTVDYSHDIPFYIEL